MTILTHPGVKTPTLGDIEFTILVEGFLVYKFSFSFRCAEVEKKILDCQILAFLALPLGPL